MKLNPPKTVTWIIANVLGILGILFYFGIISTSQVHLSGSNAFWMAGGAYILLSLATLLKGL